MKRSRRYENSIPGSNHREMAEIDKNRNATQWALRFRPAPVEEPYPPDVRSRKTLKKVAARLALPKIAPKAVG